MKLLLKGTLGAMALGGAFSGTALADDDERTYNWPKASSVEKRSDLCKSATIVGHDIEDREGEDVGKIKDLVFHPKTGRVLGLTVSHDEVEDQYLFLPTSAFEMKREKDGYSIESIHFVSSTDVMSAPRVSEDYWNKTYNRNFFEELCKRASVELDKICGDETEEDVKRSMSDWGLALASEAIGKDVYNTDNKDIGEIDNLLVNFKKGSVDYAIVGMGGLLGVAEDDRAVKWELMSCSKREDDKVVFVARESDPS